MIYLFDFVSFRKAIFQKLFFVWYSLTDERKNNYRINKHVIYTFYLAFRSEMNTVELGSNLINEISRYKFKINSYPHSVTLK